LGAKSDLSEDEAAFASASKWIEPLPNVSISKVSSLNNTGLDEAFTNLINVCTVFSL
jgi:hypothetical protein